MVGRPDLTFEEIVASKMTFDEIAAAYDEETAINAGIARDPDNPEWTDEDFARARPASEVLPELVERWRRSRGKPRVPPKEIISMRLDADMLDHFRETGEGWESRINEILRHAAFGSQDNEISETAQRLLQLALELDALKYGEFTLTHGDKSSYYFDGRLLSLDPEGAYLIGKALLPLALQAGAEAVGGLTLGADPVVTAVALTSHLEGGPVAAFIVRKEAKAHGTGQRIEGPLRAGSRVAIVDDTCSTGGSLLQAIEAAEAAGCRVVKVLALLDRREGGGAELQRRGYDFTALMAANSEGMIEVITG